MAETLVVNAEIKTPFADEYVVGSDIGNCGGKVTNVRKRESVVVVEVSPDPDRCKNCGYKDVCNKAKLKS